MIYVVMNFVADLPYSMNSYLHSHEIIQNLRQSFVLSLMLDFGHVGCKVLG